MESKLASGYGHFQSGARKIGYDYPPPPLIAL